MWLIFDTSSIQPPRMRLVRFDVCNTETKLSSLSRLITLQLKVIVSNFMGSLGSAADYTWTHISWPVCDSHTWIHLVEVPSGKCLARIGLVLQKQLTYISRFFHIVHENVQVVDLHCCCTCATRGIEEIYTEVCSAMLKVSSNKEMQLLWLQRNWLLLPAEHPS